MRIGMLGCGNIGTFLLQSLNETNAAEKIVAIYSRNYEKTSAIAEQFGAQSYESIDDFVAANLDIVIEVATIEVVKNAAVKVLKNNTPLIVSSIGAFSDADFLNEVKETSERHNVNVFVPSGAVGGLDVLQSANVLQGLKSVQLTTRKPSHTLQGAENIATEKVVFEGRAKEAIDLYPRNMNVAIAISLAGIGPDKTTVRLVADPHVEKNIHTITAHGDFGRFSIEVSNEAMPQNPKTSYLAALSVLSSVKEQSRRIKIL